MANLLCGQVTNPSQERQQQLGKEAGTVLEPLNPPTPIPTHIFLEQLLSIFAEEVGMAVCLRDLGLQVGKG